MKTQIILLLACITLCAQNDFNAQMDAALEQWEKNYDATDMSEKFMTISKEHKNEWAPLYYATFSKVISLFDQDKKQVIAAYKGLDKDFKKLEKLYTNASELKTLEGFYLTLQVAKDPWGKGATLSPKILELYNQALRLDPKNGRALYLRSQYEMEMAAYIGRDPKAKCPSLNKAISLLEQESVKGRKNYEPSWGIQEAKSAQDKFCTK